MERTCKCGVGGGRGMNEPKEGELGELRVLEKEAMSGWGGKNSRIVVWREEFTYCCLEKGVHVLLSGERSLRIVVWREERGHV